MESSGSDMASVSDPLPHAHPGNNKHTHSKPPHKSQLNCERCRKRKTKCDRAEGGCTGCQRAGVTCIVIDRPRLPRGRNGGRKKQVDVELRTRLTRLEDLIKTFAPSSDEAAALIEQPEAVSGQAQARNLESRKMKPATESANTSVNASSTTAPDMRRYLGTAFWQSLSSEIAGISEVLDDSEDEEDGITPEFHTPGAKPHVVAQVDLFLTEPGSFIYNPALLQSPDIESASALYDVYQYRFASMVPIVHGPSLKRYLSGQEDYLDLPHDDPCVKALAFAVFYAAISTLKPHECIEQFNVDRQAALRRYRFATEICLAQSDLYRTTELLVLQAFMIYITAMRVEDSSCKPWTLVAIALRLAHALRLHDDEVGFRFSAFEHEMRRRVWHELRRLDIQSALDRGTYPCLPSVTNVPMPLNLDDSDFDWHSARPLRPGQKWTNMTFFLACIDGYGNATKMELAAYGDAARPAMKDSVKGTFLSANATVLECGAYVQKPGSSNPMYSPNWTPSNTVQVHDNPFNYDTAMAYVQNKYFIYYDPANVPLHLVAMLVPKIIILQKVLLGAMPMKRDGSTPKGITDDIFESAIELLEAAYTLYTDPRCAPWVWNNRVHWHSLAVVLAKLCVQPTGPRAERAWNVVEVAFAHYGKRVADTEKGMLWKPLEKLMTRARQAKAEFQSQQSDTSSRTGSTKYETQQSLDTPPATMMPAPFTACPNVDMTQIQTMPDPTIDFNMLSFQDTTNMDLHNNALFMQVDNSPDNWGAFVDDMHANYINSDDLTEVIFQPMLPMHVKHLRHPQAAPDVWPTNNHWYQPLMEREAVRQGSTPL